MRKKYIEEIFGLTNKNGKWRIINDLGTNNT